jgi:hypothetical protein
MYEIDTTTRSKLLKPSRMNSQNPAVNDEVNGQRSTVNVQWSTVNDQVKAVEAVAHELPEPCGHTRAGA